MPTHASHHPKHFKGVMVSSTFMDLVNYRAALIKALHKAELFPVAMEAYTLRADDDIITSSLRMVQEASAYIGLISHRYGQILTDDRNPDGYSVTRLEFEEAKRLDRPTLIFIMGEDHAVKRKDIETGPEKIKKLEAFRERVKEGGRIYVEFNDEEEFTKSAIHAIERLREMLKEEENPPPVIVEPSTPAPQTLYAQKSDPIPHPPALYAEPPYIGSHSFLGRQAQLDTLDDWASPADTHPVLLFEAIGGTGKSMLTWHWINHHATHIRDDWEGIFWYSFYERGAVMADFCRRALAYMTRKPYEAFKKMKTVQMTDQLLQLLRAKPWLFVLDGLERVLVAYHRIDAAQLKDEEAGKEDIIADRDPCSAIRPEDDDLLRLLAGASPSKLLITSRLIPRILLNPASQPIPGVLRDRLPGLRPADAEALLRSCGTEGNSTVIQTYLKQHCDCHPLITGIVAGLVNNYLPDRGNFDAWAGDLNAGDALNLAELDLVQKRNHILKAAFDALSAESKQLLSMFSLLSEAVDYPTLQALNPFLTPEPEEVEVPERPEEWEIWELMSEEHKEQAINDYSKELKDRAIYEQAIKDRLTSIAYLQAPQKLGTAIKDLERRGLLQYDPNAKHYDLHPVVRSVALGGLQQAEKEQYGQRVVDHFSQQSHKPYEEAETLEDVSSGLHVIRTLLQMRKYEEAFQSFSGGIGSSLLFNLGAYSEVLTLMRVFFQKGWAIIPKKLPIFYAYNATNSVALVLKNIGQTKEAISAFQALIQAKLKEKDYDTIAISLSNLAITLIKENRSVEAERICLLSLSVSSVLADKESLFFTRLVHFWGMTRIGQWKDAKDIWKQIEAMGHRWPRDIYRPGDAENNYVIFRFWKGSLTEVDLIKAEKLAKVGKNRYVIHSLHSLRGQWHLTLHQYKLAANSLQEAVRMAREIGQIDSEAETFLALTKHHLNQLPNPHEEAERLSHLRKPFHRGLAELWLAIGDHEKATHHALEAYTWAWADGEPYVHRYELNKTIEVLEALEVPIPDLPPYDPSKAEKFPWEEEVEAAIEELRKKKEEEN